MSISENELEKKMNQQTIEIASIKNGFHDLVKTIEKNTEAVNSLITNLAVSNEKHDRNEEEIKGLIERERENRANINKMYPVINALDKLLWKIIGAILISFGAGVGIVVTFLKSS